MTDVGRKERVLIPRLPIIPKDLSSQFKRWKMNLRRTRKIRFDGHGRSDETDTEDELEIRTCGNLSYKGKIIKPDEHIATIAPSGEQKSSEIQRQLFS
ncbi:hypothetical protein AVEN_64535-1 [Araneus ventricosus]|uniref:Uncharacterized protein n=1 Tax=Araneus ventricosus TaxID=182803 RepID=A0A4Y2MIX2_ARAVE|nr:hypothetical protein AVEN_64535-1 [Araneus ventricosus]